MSDRSFFCITCKAEVDPAYKACPYCGEPITDFLRQYLIDPIDGKYQILSRLGIGGMGEVFKVLHLRLNSVRVVKLMRAKLQESDAEARFIREARLATRISHPNVATLFDFSTLADGTHYMVWEYIEGTNLAEMLRVRGPLPAGECARLCIQALDGLEAVHRSGIVHRDISPENIMIAPMDDGSSRVKIIDLGIAKQSADATDDQTKTGMFVGKWKYCSPEHFGFLDSGEAIDPRADLYSFGIVMYELLTGRPPFVAQSPQQYLLQHSSQPPPALGQIEPSLARLETLQSVVFKALEKKRDDRYADAGEFRRALLAILPSLPDIGDVETLSGSTPIPAAAPPAPGGNLPFQQRVLAPEPLLNTNATTVDEVMPAGAPAPAGIGRSRSRMTIPLIVVSVIVAVAAGARFLSRDRPDIQPPTVAAAASVVPRPEGTLGLNAYPWAEITRVTALRDGNDVLTTRMVTPAFLQVEPGEYEIEAINPQMGAQVIQRVTVGAKSRSVVMLQFGEPQLNDLPSFLEPAQ